MHKTLLIRSSNPYFTPKPLFLRAKTPNAPIRKNKKEKQNDKANDSNRRTKRLQRILFTRRANQIRQPLEVDEAKTEKTTKEKNEVAEGNAEDNVKGGTEMISDDEEQERKAGDGEFGEPLAASATSSTRPSPTNSR
jgi:hypothetical protein